MSLCLIFFFVLKVIRTKKYEQAKNYPGVENQELLSQRIISHSPAGPTFLGSSTSIPYKSKNEIGLTCIYIYIPFTCEADFIFDLDGIELGLPRKVGLAGECDMIC